MRLITLNTWGGIVYEPLLLFVEKHADSTDIFCFQEMIFGPKAEFSKKNKARLNLFSEIEKRLTDFIPYKYLVPDQALHFQDELLPSDTRPGQTIFVRKTLSVKSQGGFRGYVADNIPGVTFGGKGTGSCEWLELETTKNETLTVLNLHGLWQENSQKADTPERFTQSEIIKKFLSSRPGGKILCGDFNLTPTGKSIKMLEENMVNLVKTHNITSTRSSFYTKPGKFADYILISPEIQVEKFEVLQDEVSDHLPLFLEFK